MAAAEQSGPGPDLYQLLGVSRQASREVIAQAWRRQARNEHPDARPADAAAPGRFRDLAGPTVPVVSLTKGIELSTFRRPSEIIAEVLGTERVVALSGPFGMYTRTFGTGSGGKA